MKLAIEKELKEANLQFIEITVTKIIQLYETKNSRHSVMIVGATGSGKSVTWKMLRNTLSRLKKEQKGSTYQIVRVRRWCGCVCCWPALYKTLDIWKLEASYHIYHLCFH